MVKEKRFETIYTQGTLEAFRIVIDKQTGINYLYVSNGNSGGLTVLLDSDGKPIITKEN